MSTEKQLQNVPLGFNFDVMCKKLKAPTPNRKVLYSGLESQGYKVEPSYITPSLYKTNAPFKAIYDLVKAWKKKDLGEEKYLSNVKDPASLKIL